MRGGLRHAPGGVRGEERHDPESRNPNDTARRAAAPRPLAPESVGSVEEVGSEVVNITPGQFVVGSFFASDNTCELCQAGYQTSCVNRQGLGTTGRAQAQRRRVPLADGTLVATPDIPSEDLVPSFLAASDVLGTGWFGAVAATAGPGKTLAVVGDGAVGLMAVLAAK